MSVHQMIRKNPAHDTTTPAGQQITPVHGESAAVHSSFPSKPRERLIDVIEGAVRRSSEQVIQSPKEAFSEGYAQGWMDCQASQRKWQEENKG